MKRQFKAPYDKSTMKRQFKAPYNAQRKLNFQQPDHVQDRASVAKQDTAEVAAMSRQKLNPRLPDLATRPTSVAEQHTASLQAKRNLSFSGRVGELPLYRQSPQEQGLHGGAAAVVDQDTASLASVHVSPPTTGNNPPGKIRQVIRAGVARLQDPQPEGLLTRGLQSIRPELRLGTFPLLAFTNGLGLLVVSLSYYISIEKYAYTTIEATFLGGLLLMLVPNTLRLLSRAPSRVERIYLLCILGICCYFVQFMTSPLYFSGYDESLHWRTANDILRTGHLFSMNAVLPVSPYYPGLELITNSISSTTGLSIFAAGNIVIVLSRILMILALFLFYEQITSSSRMASVGVLIYMANQHFLFFDSFYSYETLALPLATFMIYILVRYGDADKNRRWVVATAWLVLIAVNATHHMTSYVIDGLLLLWAGVNFFRPVSHRMRIYLVILAVFSLLFSLAYAFLLPGNPVWVYLSDFFGSIFNQLTQIIAGTSKARPLFSSSGGSAPIWDRLLITGSVAIISFCLPFGLISLRRHSRNALAVVFSIASLAYPLTQVFRFTEFGGQITDRAAAFLFLPIAYVLTILIIHFWPTRRLSKRAISLITSVLVVVFLGGVIVESGPNLTSIPCPYQPVTDARSIEPQGIEAALWSLIYLGPNNRVATDRINQMLMNTYGEQRMVTTLEDRIDVSPIFYSPSLEKVDITILQAGQIHYLVVDLRLSQALPAYGAYFEADRPTSVISRSALLKFNTVAQIDRLFDSGDIVIYDIGALIH